MTLALGPWTLDAVLDGTFALDGGAMFGVVPKPLWEQKIPADEKNRIPLALRCLLAQSGGRRVLVDTGIGDVFLGTKFQDIYKIEKEPEGVRGGLRRLGVAPEEITDVVITHLHFDHAGGVTHRRRDGARVLSFPRATYHVQRRQWAWAHHPTERDRQSFMAEAYALLEESGRLHLLEGETELCPGLTVHVSEGHTVGMQLVRVSADGASLVHCADLIPTSAHLRVAWHMGYDLYPLTCMEEKRMLLAQAIEEGWTLFFEHDPRIAACKVREEKGEAAIASVVDL